MKFSNVLIFVAVSASTSSGILAARLGGQRVAVDPSSSSWDKRQGKAGVGEACAKDADCQTGESIVGVRASGIGDGGTPSNGG